jgi:fructooligosaccharide transport system permease protein
MRKINLASKRHSSYIRQQHLTVFLFMTPALLLLTIFLLLPTILAFGFSFTDFYTLRPNDTVFVGFNNYKTLFGDELFWKCLRNTVYFVVVLVPIEGAIALGLALLTKTKRIGGTTFFRISYFTPVITSITVVSILWVFLYNPGDGLINSFLNIFGIPSQMFLRSSSQAMNSILVMTIWQGVGYQMVIFLAGLNNISQEMYEAASIDGANAFGKFIHITIPGLENVFAFIVVYVTIMAFKLFVQPHIMTFGGPENSTRTIVYYIYQNGFQYKKAGYASSIAVIFFLIVVIVSMILQKIFVKKNDN